MITKTKKKAAKISKATEKTNLVIQELYDLTKKLGKKDRDSTSFTGEYGGGSRREFDLWLWERNTGYRVRADKEKYTSWSRSSDSYGNRLNLKVFKGEKCVFSAVLDQGGYSESFCGSEERYGGRSDRKGEDLWKIWSGEKKIRTLKNLLVEKVAGHYRGETWVDGYTRTPR